MQRNFVRLIAPLALLASSCLCTAELRVGIIGTDTSHVLHFTRMLNDPRDPDHISGARVVAAYKGGSPDIVSSRGRVDDYAHQIRKLYNVEIVPDIPTLCSKVDAILLE